MRGIPTTSGSGPAYDFFGHHQTSTVRGGNRLYAAGATNGAQTAGAGTTTPVVNKLYTMALSNPVATTVTRVGFQLTTVGAAGNLARMGIYDSTSRTNLFPNNLVVDAGEVLVDAGLGYKDIVLGTPVTLAADSLYWLCWVGSGGTARLRAMLSNQLCSVLGWSSVSLGTSDFGAFGWKANHAYAALPATFPVAGAEVNGGSTLTPLMLLYGLY